MGRHYRIHSAKTRSGLTQLPARAQADVAGTGSVELLLTSVHHRGRNNLPLDLRQSLDALLGTPPAIPAIHADPATEDPHADTAAEAATVNRAPEVGYANHFTAIARDKPWRPVLIDATGAL